MDKGATARTTKVCEIEGDNECCSRSGHDGGRRQRRMTIGDLDLAMESSSNAEVKLSSSVAKVQSSFMKLSSSMEELQIWPWNSSMVEIYLRSSVAMRWSSVGGCGWWRRLWLVAMGG